MGRRNDTERAMAQTGGQVKVDRNTMSIAIVGAALVVFLGVLFMAFIKPRLCVWLSRRAAADTAPELIELDGDDEDHIQRRSKPLSKIECNVYNISGITSEDTCTDLSDCAPRRANAIKTRHGLQSETGHIEQRGGQPDGSESAETSGSASPLMVLNSFSLQKDQESMDSGFAGETGVQPSTSADLSKAMYDYIARRGEPEGQMSAKAAVPVMNVVDNPGHVNLAFDLDTAVYSGRGRPLDLLTPQDEGRSLEQAFAAALPPPLQAAPPVCGEELSGGRQDAPPLSDVVAMLYRGVDESGV